MLAFWVLLLVMLSKKCQETLKRIEVLADGWGVIIVQDDNFGIDFEAPFDMDLGLDWNSRIVYFRFRRELNDEEGRRVLAGIIHELGHVVADKRYPGEEFDFLGWEWLVAKSVGFTFAGWCRANDNYSVTAKGECIGEIGPRRTRRVIDERVLRAQEIGIVDSLLQPLKVR